MIPCLMSYPFLKSRDFQKCQRSVAQIPAVHLPKTPAPTWHRHESELAESPSWVHRVKFAHHYLHPSPRCLTLRDEWEFFPGKPWSRSVAKKNRDFPKFCSYYGKDGSVIWILNRYEIWIVGKSWLNSAGAWFFEERRLPLSSLFISHNDDGRSHVLTRQPTVLMCKRRKAWVLETWWFHLPSNWNWAQMSQTLRIMRACNFTCAIQVQNFAMSLVEHSTPTATTTKHHKWGAVEAKPIKEIR